MGEGIMNHEDCRAEIEAMIWQIAVLEGKVELLESLIRLALEEGTE